MTLQEIDILIGDVYSQNFHNVERRDYKAMELESPTKIVNCGRKFGILYLSIGETQYVDASILEKSVILLFRDDYDTITKVEFTHDEFTKAHLLMFVDLINDYNKFHIKFNDSIRELRKGNLPKEYLRMDKLDELTNI